MKTALQVQEAQGAAWEAMRDIKRNAEKEGRELTAEERSRFLKFSKEYDQLSEEFQVAKRAEEMEAKEAEQRAQKEQSTNKNQSATRSYEQVFWDYARAGKDSLTGTDKRTLGQGFEIRGTDPQTTTVARGGYTIPEGFSNMLETRMAFIGPMLNENAVQIFRTTTGNAIPWPTVDDTSVNGAILNEDSPSVAVSDMTFGQKTLNAYTYHSNIVKVSIPLVEDSAFNLQDFLADQFSQRLARAINAHLTTGSGNSQPNGFVTAITAASGEVSAADNATLARTDLVRLIHSVDRAYRTGPKVHFQMHDGILSEVRQLGFGSADDRPLYLRGDATAGEPDRLEGFPLFVNNDMASAIANDANVIAFGDFSKYVVRVVNNISFLRLDERFADQLQVGFIAYYRVDGELIQDSAIKVLRMTNT